MLELHPNFNDSLFESTTTNISSEILFNHVEELRKQSEPTPHLQLLERLTERINPIDYWEVGELGNDENLTYRHYTIITVEQVLNLAKENKWGLCRHHNFIYLYNGAFWRELAADELKTFLGEAAEKMSVDKYKARFHQFRDTLFKQFITLANLPKPDQPKDVVLVNLKNGTFEITPNGTKLRPFDPSDFITYQLPFEYDPEAKAPRFEAYLEKCLPDKERQRVLAEYLGYVFTKNGTLKVEKALFLYGTGANGKSVFYEVVKALLGTENTSHFSLQDLTDKNGYYRAKIANRLVNYASEISSKLEAGIFKQLASGETISARLPYGNPMEISDYAKLIFNVNELPGDVEQTAGFFRRFLIVPFDVTISEAEQDRQLHTKIIDNELSGVFNWVLEGLNRLLKQKQFSNCQASNQAREVYKTQSDSVKLFIHENSYQSSPTNYLVIKDLYLQYRSFCIDDNFKPVNKTNFIKRLKGFGVTVEKKKIGNVAFLEIVKTDF